MFSIGGHSHLVNPATVRLRPLAPRVAGHIQGFTRVLEIPRNIQKQNPLLRDTSYTTLKGSQIDA